MDSGAAYKGGMHPESLHPDSSARLLQQSSVRELKDLLLAMHCQVSNIRLAIDKSELIALVHHQRALLVLEREASTAAALLAADEAKRAREAALRAEEAALRAEEAAQLAERIRINKERKALESMARAQQRIDNLRQQNDATAAREHSRDAIVLRANKWCADRPRLFDLLGDLVVELKIVDVDHHSNLDTEDQRAVWINKNYKKVIKSIHPDKHPHQSDEAIYYAEVFRKLHDKHQHLKR